MSDRRDRSFPLLRRRHVLTGLGGAAGVAALGCGSSDETPGGTTGPGGNGGFGQGGGPGTGGAGGGQGGFGGAGGAGGAGGQGGAGGSGPNCEDTLGMSPQELLAPIEHIVVLCMENRSFDHYFGGSLALVEGRADVDGLTGAETNPHPQDGPIAVHPMMNLEPEDPPHQWNAVHTQWNLGDMDGFVQASLDENPNHPDYDEVMGYYLRDQVPVHHALADAYALPNAYFCSVLGGTWPNRFYLHGATSQGLKQNQPLLTGFDSIWPYLKAQGLTVKNYFGDVPWALGAYFKQQDLVPYAQFEADAAAGTLPNFSIIDPRFFGGGANDDHPTNANVPLAQALISDVYTTLAQSSAWDKCLFVLTYDEHGGFFDHVAPPISGDDLVDFNRMGVRVPAVIAGPYVRHGCAVNTIVDHVAVLATLATRWGVAPLTTRMSTSNDLSSFIDPTLVQSRSPRMPITLPRLTISSRAIAAHAERLARGTVPAQHPELIDALRQQGILKKVMRDLDHDATLKHHLERAHKRGVIRLL